MHSGHDTSGFDVGTAGIVSDSFANQIDRFLSASGSLVAQVNNTASMTGHAYKYSETISFRGRKS